ncbi:hypothetical protein H8S95_01115 [Pontibacter sp. KCTC 32443]|uniref:hypothetical protein n=1 Tax=Pontibacter TaxID=323449 RepID=UPI00164EBD83|nr:MULTISPECIES: hypothetical protein [Pontibacter]MBC5772647.1 hypothetical protein [Pontibacter sp. KCTC 32443]
MAGCNTEEDAVKPLATSNQEELVGWTDAVCNLIQSFGATASPGLVTTVEENGALMHVTTQRRASNGKYLPETHAMLVGGRETPELIGFMDAIVLGVSNMLTVPNESGDGINQTGGRIIIDFTPSGSATVRDMILTDIDTDEKGSKIELFSNTGQLLLSKEIPVTGDKNPLFVSLENVPGVAKAIVTFGDKRSLNGSGAIARIQMCVEGAGRCVSLCSAPVNKLWLQYVGTRPINVKARMGTESLMNGNGMKPGTMFKIEHGSDLRNTLTLETNRKDVPAVSLTCGDNGQLSLSGDNDLFRVVDARSSNYSYPLCLQE